MTTRTSSTECAIAIVGLPSRKDPEAPAHYGDWIWVGQMEGAEKVAQALAQDGRFTHAFELGAELIMVPAGNLSPAQLRRARNRVRHRLEVGPIIPSASGEEECLDVPRPVQHRVSGEVAGFVLMLVVVPSPSTPFAFQVVQAMAEEAERIFAPTVVDPPTPPASPVTPAVVPQTPVLQVSSGTVVTYASSPSTEAHEDELPSLFNRKGQFLVELLKKKAMSYETRMTTEEVAQLIPNNKGIMLTANNLKTPVSWLQKAGYIATDARKGGGCWLKTTGEAKAKEILASRK